MDGRMKVDLIVIISWLRTFLFSVHDSNTSYAPCSVISFFFRSSFWDILKHSSSFEILWAIVSAQCLMCFPYPFVVYFCVPPLFDDPWRIINDLFEYSFLLAHERFYTCFIVMMNVSLPLGYLNLLVFLSLS